MKSDLQIQHDVQRELEYDPRVQAASIGVEVREGIVALAGCVGSYSEKMAAQLAAHRVHGVKDVANTLRVTGPNSPYRDDADVARAVRQAMEWDVFVPADRIQSSVSDGWVTLSGTVERLLDRDEAERCISGLKGVAGVINEISIVPPEVEERLIRLIIEEALERRADREAGHIGVEVCGGTVVLTGEVRSMAERRAILGAAGHAPGVYAVDDRLVVAPV